MYVVVRGKVPPLRRWSAFTFSISVHGALLGWLVLATPADPDAAKSVYDAEILPHEDHLVWYNLRGSLPDVSPSAESHDRRPPRAREKFHQTLVAGDHDRGNDRQMIFAPEPKVLALKLPPLPNVLAVTAPAPLKAFVPPAARRITAPAPLPEAPQPAALKIAGSDYKPALPAAPLRQFTPPPAKAVVKSAVPLPEAPKTGASLPVGSPAYHPALPAAPLRQFTPPTAKAVVKSAVPLPEAPKTGASLPVGSPAYHPALPPAPLRDFTPPAAKAVVKTGAPLPEAPKTGASLPVGSPAYHPALPPAPLRDFTPPRTKRAADATHAAPLPDAPAVPTALDAASTAALAIAGLDPARLTDLPKPPGPREGSFSAGPEVRPDGGHGDSRESSTHVVVPGLLARGGTAAIPMRMALPRPMDPMHPLDSVMPPPEPHGTRVSDAPDPILEGRVIYTMAIQMPNVTSYSGSWMVWFADRASAGGKAEIEPPVPLRKVDPKYVATAVADRVEGKVRLSAIIRKDGRVDSVSLLRHLDPRLDETAEEALGKWIFQPARKDGMAIDVDAVFEIPFYLAPKAAR